MKVGDLVRHRFDGHCDEVGIVVKIVRATGVPSGMVEVLWSIENTYKNSRLYRIRHLETVNESR